MKPMVSTVQYSTVQYSTVQYSTRRDNKSSPVALPVSLFRVVKRARTTAFVYDGFAFKELEEMLRFLALSYADL